VIRTQHKKHNMGEFCMQNWYALRYGVCISTSMHCILGNFFSIGPRSMLPSILIHSQIQLLLFPCSVHT